VADRIIAPTPALALPPGGSRIGRPDGPPGVTATVNHGASCFQVRPWRGHRGDAIQALADRFGGPPPPTPGVIRGDGDFLIVWDGPDGWLVLDRSGASTAEALAACLPEACAVIDQSDGRVLVEMRGPNVRDVLGKGMEPDFGEDAFPVGAAAIGRLNHLVCHVWRTEDRFGLLTPRSSVGDVWHWLGVSAMEFGLEMMEPAPDAWGALADGKVA